MKKAISLILTLILGISVLAGCNGGSNADVSGTSSAGSEKGAYKIGLVQFMEHESLDMIRTAFMEKLQSKIDDGSVTVDYQNGQGETANLNSICQNFVGDKVDLIVAIATPAAQAAVTAAEGTDTKILFVAVNYPQTDLNIQNLEAPEGNITGTSDLLNIASIVDLALKVDPDLKTFGMLYNSGEPNSVAAASDAKAYCEEKGIEVIESTISNTSEIQQAATDLVSKVDAIFTGTDNSIASAMPIVSEITKNAKVPFYVGADTMVMAGGLATIGVDYKDLGARSGDMAIKLAGGAAISEIPVFFYDEYQAYINKTTAAAIGVEFPADVTESAVIFE